MDAFTLRHLCKELNELFKGGKVNRIVQPSENDVVFTVYTGKKTERLVLDVNPARPRICVDEIDRESPLTAPNFCMLLRKHLLSATIENIRLIGFDRIVAIDLLTSSEFSDSTLKTLYVELMGRYSNIILTEDGKILGGNRGINCFDAGIRPLIVGYKYTYPPTNEKREPSDQTLTEYFTAFNGDNLADYICQGVQGVALSTANEAILAYSESIGTDTATAIKTLSDTAKKFAKFLQEFLYNPPVNPCIMVEDGMYKDVCVFPYKTLGCNAKYYPTLMRAESEFFTAKIIAKRIADKAERIKTVLKNSEKKAFKRVGAIMAKERDASDVEKDKILGELILANVYKIKRGDTIFVAQNYYDDYKEIEIPLNEFKTPAENAEAYYKKYNKKKRTLISLAPQRAKEEEELDYIRSVQEEFALYETEKDLDGILEELKEYGLVKDNSPKKKKKEQSGARVYVIDGFTLKVGRNNVENDALTLNAKSRDIWLHSKDYHSAHAIIAYENKEIPQKVILIGAEICAYYSKARNGGKTEIAYTEKKHVKKPNGAKPGFCTYTDFKTVTVTGDKHAEFLKSE